MFDDILGLLKGEVLPKDLLSRKYTYLDGAKNLLIGWAVPGILLIILLGLLGSFLSVLYPPLGAIGLIGGIVLFVGVYIVLYLSTLVLNLVTGFVAGKMGKENDLAPFVAANQTLTAAYLPVGTLAVILTAVPVVGFFLYFFLTMVVSGIAGFYGYELIKEHFKLNSYKAVLSIALSWTIIIVIVSVIAFILLITLLGAVMGSLGALGAGLTPSYY
ncbi:MAG TPA: hypothetical protein VJK05_02155 [archaeon]|nr:hypothetical protein [archaeon]